MPARVGWEIIWEPLPEMIAQTYFTAAAKASTLGVPMREAMHIVSSEIAMNFASEGRPTPWTRLAPSTVRQRGSAGPILQRTGELYRQAVNASNWTLESSTTQAVAAFPDPTGYGKFHVTGRIGFTEYDFMPIRDWTYVSEEAEQQIEDEFANWVMSE